MLKQTLPYMPLIDEEKKKKLSSFCGSVNRRMKDFKDVDKEEISEFLINFITGLSKDDINPSIYKELVNYVKSNFGEINITYYQDYIKEIKVGSISMGGVFRDNYDNLTISDRTLEGKTCYGHIPTVIKPLELNFVYDDKKIISNTRTVTNGSDCNNIHIGDYYFNREMIQKGVEGAFLVRFTVPYVNQLQADITSYDSLGNVIKKDICVNYLSTVDDKKFYAEKQILNGLERIDNLRTYKEGESGLRR